MADTEADMVWTDPPYGVNYVGKTDDALTIDNDSLSSAGLKQLLVDAFTSAIEVCKPGGTWFVTGPPGPLGSVFGDVLIELDIYRQTLIWVKDVFVLGHSDYHYRHEPMFYGWKPGSAHHEPPDRAQDTIWEFDRPKRSREHPTMKPVALVERAITNHTIRDALILDPFAGSGTTLIAAESTGRHARLIENDPIYCDVICRRWQEATGIKPVLESTGEPHDFAETSP